MKDTFVPGLFFFKFSDPLAFVFAPVSAENSFFGDASEEGWKRGLNGWVQFVQPNTLILLPSVKIINSVKSKSNSERVHACALLAEIGFSSGLYSRARELNSLRNIRQID